MTYEMHYFSKKNFLNQIEYGPFRGCSQMEGRGRQKGPNYHPPPPTSSLETIKRILQR